MKIEKAIEMLQQEQKSGTKSIVFAYWKAELFGKEDDDHRGVRIAIHAQRDCCPSRIKERLQVRHNLYCQ